MLAIRYVLCRVFVIFLESMLKTLAQTLLLCAAATLSAHVPNLRQTDGSFLAGSSASSGLPLPPTNSTLLSNGPLSTSNTLKIGCDSRRYGRDLKVKSCRNVFRYVKHENEQVTFSERDSGISYDVGLPLRTYSSKSVLPKTRYPTGGARAESKP